MSVKQKWKTFGKNTGKAFANFGRSVKTTARVVVGADERINEDGESTLKTSWKKTGKGFGEAGKSLGKAAAATAKKPFGKEEEEFAEETNKDVIDVEAVETEPEEQPE